MSRREISYLLLCSNAFASLQPYSKHDTARESAIGNGTEDAS